MVTIQDDGGIGVNGVDIDGECVCACAEVGAIADLEADGGVVGAVFVAIRNEFEVSAGDI